MSADPRQRLVVAHSVDPAAAEHEVQGNLALARWLAEVQKLEFGGRYEPELHQRGPLYLVPTRTLVGRETAVRLGVNSDEDLLGGFVEHAFIAGKAIVHPLPRGGVVPEGWNPLFAEKVRDVVLNGVSVFSLADAHRAGARMLAEGPVRAKLAEACGGLGQYVAHDLDELDAWLGGLEERQLAQGLVLEANLESIVTHSVGQLRVNGFLLSYHGHQHQTRNARGELVYAGSDLLVARGGYAELLALDLAREVRQAISTRGSSTPPRRSSSPAASPRGATTTLPRAGTATVGSASACSSSPGGSAARAAPRSPRWKPSAPIRGCPRCAPRRSRSTKTSACRTTAG